MSFGTIYCYAPQYQAVRAILEEFIPVQLLNSNRMIHPCRDPYPMAGQRWPTFMRIVTHPQQPDCLFRNYIRALGAVEWDIDDSSARARYRERHG